MVGSFLKDRNNKLVTIDGSPVIEKILKKSGRKPRACQQCGFERWCVNDTCYVVSRIGTVQQDANENNHNNGSSPPLDFDGGGSLEWLCPNCAVKRGLPKEFFTKNKYGPPLDAFRNHRGSGGGGDGGGFLCGAFGPDTTTNTNTTAAAKPSPTKTSSSTDSESSSSAGNNQNSRRSTESNALFDLRKIFANYFCFAQDC